MSIKRVFIIGYFGYRTNQIDGQTIKTRSVLNLLKKYRVPAVKYYDTQEFQFKRITIIKMIVGIATSKTLLYLPGQRNLKTVFPFIYFLTKIFKVDIVNLAVGGWLDEFLGKNPKVLAKFRSFKIIFVESESLKKSLNSRFALSNVRVFPNFRITDFKPERKREQTVGFKLVFMARITKEKGLKYIFDYAEYCKTHEIDDLIIDFYGPIDKKDQEYFETHVSKYSFVQYKGLVEPEKVFDTLSSYSVLALPSFYIGEGFPGTIIDSYIAGVPVIVSDWRFLSEYVDHGKTGFVFNLDNPSEFIKYLEIIRLNPQILSELKIHAFNKSKVYSADRAWELLKEQL